MPSSRKPIVPRNWTGSDLEAFMKRFKIRQHRMAELLMLASSSGRISIGTWIRKKDQVLYGPVCVALSFLEEEMEKEFNTAAVAREKKSPRTKLPTAKSVRPTDENSPPSKQRTARREPPSTKLPRKK